MKYANSIARSFPAARRTLYLAIATQMLFAAGANASPAGGVVVAGEGHIDQSGLDTTIIQNTDRMAVDWTSFNIQADERVQFIQPSETSVALNRILGSEASQIFGRLDANGHVILMNPNGVFFGEGAMVNVGGLVASGLAINPDEFMNGDFALNAVEGMDGAVINQGIINAATGGNVALIGQRVENQGLISAKLGSVTLAAGKEAVLTFDHQGLLGVRVTQEILQNELGVESAVSNTGEINAEGGRILLTGSVSQDIFSRAVNSEGLNTKTSVVMHDDGSFTIGAGADVVNTGTLNAGTSDNNAAGHVVVLGENINHSGAILANSTHSGPAGNIELHSRDTTLLTDTSTVNASASNQGKGGDIKVLGDRVGVFDQSSMDASGVNGGGDIHIGGGFQGKNPELRNATRTVIGKDTEINADAFDLGDGGEVIVWAEQTTSFTGEISVRGGSHGGDGGFVEVSGKENLRFDGSVDRTGVEGKSGTLLLDPETLQITSNEDNAVDNIELDDGELLFEYAAFTATISDTAINNALATGDVLLQASRSIFIGETDVDVYIVSEDPQGRNSLMLEAGSYIRLNNAKIDLENGIFAASAGLIECVISACPQTDQVGEIETGNTQIRAGNQIFLNTANSIYLDGDFTSASLSIRAGGEVAVADLNIVSPAVSINIGTTSTNGILLPSGGSYNPPSLQTYEPNDVQTLGFRSVEVGDGLQIEAGNSPLFFSIQSEFDINLPEIGLSFAGESSDPGRFEFNSTTGSVVLGSINNAAGDGPLQISVSAASSIDVVASLSTFGGVIALSADSVAFGDGTILDNTGSSTLATADLSIISRQDIVLPTIISGGGLNVDAQQGSVIFGDSLSVAGETHLKAGQDINLSGDTIFNPQGDVYFNADRIIRVERSSADLEFGEPLPYIKLASDNTASFFWEAGSGIDIERLELGRGDFIASAGTNLDLAGNPGIIIKDTLSSAGKILLRASNSIDYSRGPDKLENQSATYLGIFAGDFVLLPYTAAVEGDVEVRTYTGAENFLDTFTLSNGTEMSLPKLRPVSEVSGGRIGWYAAGDFSISSSGGDIYLESDVIDHFGGTSLDASSPEGHGKITLIARDFLRAPLIKYSQNASVVQNTNPEILMQAGSILLDRDYDFDNAGVLNFTIQSDAEVVLGVVRGDEHDTSEGGFLGTRPEGGRFFDTNGGDDDLLNLNIAAGGIIFQKYDIFTGGGNYTATASEFIFNDSVQINADFSNSTTNGLFSTGNIFLTETITDFPISSRMILPNIRTQGDCAGQIECGNLDISTNRDVLDRPFGEAGDEKQIKVFGDTTIVSGALDLFGELSDIQFDGLFSLNTGYVSLATKGGLQLSDWLVNGTTHVAVGEVEGRSSDIVSNSTLDVGWPAIFSTPGELILQGAGTRFRARVSLQGSRVELNHDGDLDLEGLFLTGGPGGAASIINVNGNVTSSATSALFVEPATDRQLSLDIIGRVVDEIYQPASPVVFNVTGDLLLSSPDSQISSIQILNAQNVQLTNSTDMDIAGINAQSLRLDTSGNVTQTGAINVSGESLFNLSGVAGLTLENAANNFNEVSINSSSTNASRITDGDDMLLGNISARSNIQIISQGDGALVSQKASSQITLAPGGLMSISADNIHLGESASSIQMDDGSLTLTAEQSLSFSGAISGVGATPSRLAASVIDAVGAELNINATATFAGFDADTSLISLGDGNDVINVASNTPFYIESGLGDDTFNVLAEGLSILNLNGNEGIDALVGADGDNDWEIGAVNEGQLISAGAVTGFFEIENLIGGAGSDSYSFTNPQFDGMFFNGGGGINSLSIFSNQALEWQLNADGGQLSLPESQVSGSFANIQTLTTFDPSTFFINDLNTTVTDIQGSTQSGYTFDFSNIADAFSLDLKAFPFVLQGIEYFHVVGNGTLSSLVGTDQNNLWVLSDTGIALWTNADFESAARFEPAFATFQNFAKLEGGAADNDFVVESENLEITLVGSDDDRLFGNNHDGSVNNIWTISGVYSGSLNGNILFDNICTLQGNAGDDTFTFSADSIIKNISADAGDDTFILASNISAELLDGGDGQDTLNRDGLNSIYTYLNQVIGGDAVYTTANIEVETNTGGSTTVMAVEGYDAEWTIDGDGAISVTATDAGGTAVTNRFNAVTRLEGGSGDDAFILLPGGAIADGILGSGDDSLRASDTTNTWTINAVNGGELAVQEDGTSLLFGGIANLIGGAGSDLFDIATGGSISGSIDGGAGTDRLQISDAAAINSWQLSLQNSLGLVNQFRGIETLVGNANNDIFTFAAVSDVKKIEGRGGNNTLDWRADEVVINLCGCVESNDVEFSGINNFIADRAFNNTIIGLNEQNTWTVTGADSGTLNAVNFSGFKILQGGTAEDVLAGFDEAQTWQIGEPGDPQLNTLSTLDKQITFRGMESLLGGAGEDAFYVDTSVAPVSLSMHGGGGVNVLYGNMNNLVGNDWTIDGVNAGTLNESVLFNNIQNLEGNAGVDTVTFAQAAEINNVHTQDGDDLVILADAVSAGLLDGGTGNNVLRLFGLSTVVDILGRLIPGDDNYNAVNFFVDSTDGGFVTVRGLDDIDAEWRIDGDGTLTVLYQDELGQQQSVFHSNVARLEGANANNTFVLLSDGQLFDAIVGDGTDTVRVENNLTNNWVVNNPDAGQVTTEMGVNLVFEGIANLIGGSGSDIFDIVTGGSISGSIDGGVGVDTLRISDAAAVNNWQLATQNTVELADQFLGIETLVGNANNDHFIIGGTTDVVAIDGGAGANRLTAFDQTNSWSLTADNAGSVTGLTSFNNIQTLVGGAVADTFTLGSGSSIAEIYGGAGDDSFVIGRDVTADNIFGDAGDDSFDVDLGLILSGALDGGTGGEVAGDYLNLSKYTVLTASTDLEALLGFAFRNFERIDQPNNQGVYSGGDATNFWYITGENQGRLEIRDGANAGVYEFNDVHSLLGGSGEDVFIFANDAAAVTTIIDGGAGVGANTLDLSAQGLINQWLIDGTNSGRVSNDSNTTGNLFTNIAYLIGGGNRDNFSLQAGGTIAGVVDGGLGEDQLAIAVAQTSTWTLGATSGHAVTGIASFENVESLVGSAGEDTFNVVSETLDVMRIDGAAGSDAINFQYANPVVVNLHDGTAGGLQVSAIERFIAGNTGSTLIAADTSNTWNLDGENSGSIRYLVDTGAEAINVAFDGFGNLQGGAVDDQFTFQTGASFSGTFNAGAGTDRVSVQALTTDTHVTTDASVGLPTGVVGLRLRGIEQLLGNGRTWLYGASDQSYTWTISGQRSGQVTSTLVDADNQLLAFENLSAIVGGAHDDIFRVTVATPLLSLDGGAAVTSDLVDYSQVNGNLRINLATALSGQNGVLAGVEGIRGNNSGPDSVHTAELVAADGNNIWSIGTAGSDLADGINDGEVTSAGQTIQFLDFNQLTGGAGVDSFTLAGGVLLGTVNGGAGNDVFDVTLAGANTGTLIDGGLGQDDLTLTGGDAAALMTYTAAANGGEFDYSLTDIHFKLSHQAVETIRDNSRAQALEIRGSNLADTITLNNGGFRINGSDAIEHANKTRIAVRSGINDTIEIADHLVVAESLTLANGSVITNDPATSSISTAHLILDAARDVGLASARLRTSVDELSVRNSAGDIYLQEQNGLNLAEFTANGVFDLVLLNGDLTSSIPLTATDVFRVAANNGDITLRGANELRDDVALAGGRVELHNASTLTLVGVTAEDLILRTQRGIEGDGPLVVSGLTEIDAQGDVRLDFSTNDFNRVRVTNAWNLTLVDQNTLELLDINASGTVVVRSANTINVNDNIAGGVGVDVSSGSGSINQNGSISTTNGSIVVEAGNGEVNFGDDARVVANGGSVNISAGSGNVNMGSDTRIAANGGNVNIEAAESVVVAEVVSSGNVAINAGSGSVSDGNGGATNIAAGGLQSSSNTGFGSEDALETQVGSIDVTTNTGNVGISNTGDVTVEAIRTEGGSIAVTNQGNVDLTAGSVSAANGAVGSDVSLDVNLGSVKQTGPISVPAITGGVVLINAPQGSVAEGNLSVNADVVRITALSKAGEIFVNPGADKIEYFSGSFKFEDQLLSVEPLDDIDPAIFTNVRSYFYNDISLLLPSDQRYDEEEEEESEE